MAVKPVEDEEIEDEEIENEEEKEAQRLKTLAEERYKQSKLKSALKYAEKAKSLYPNLDGISEMVTTFNILIAATKPSSKDSPPDWYKILQVEPFSHINSIKKQYKKLALTLHPDKNTSFASEEAFKHVGEAFRVLSDKNQRKDYDIKFRLVLQSQATQSSNVVSLVDTFWTACSTCRLFHQFERQYIGHNLICPNCKKSFLAEEVSMNNEETRVSDKGRSRVRVRSLSEVNGGKESGGQSVVGNEKRKDSILNFLDRLGLKSPSKKAKTGKEMTLAEMQLEAKRKASEKQIKIKESGERKENENEKMETVEMDRNMEKVNEIETRAKKMEKEKNMTMKEMMEKTQEKNNKDKKKKVVDKKTQKEKEKKKKGIEEINVAMVSKKSSNLEVMRVEDSDFYDFDKDRMERSFKRCQVWALYDDDDEMPRNYGLINKVVSVNPFKVKMSWLDLQNTREEGLICWETSGSHISCGRFKVGRETVIEYVDLFSHIVECERIARNIYRIYPKKGEIWALYKEKTPDGDEGREVNVDNRSYDIVVFLTSHSDTYVSIAYLEKVKGFKTVFERREIGSHAIRWFEKDNVRLFSHQIPSRKLSGKEATGLPEDCWELDPASLPQDLLIMSYD